MKHFDLYDRSQINKVWQIDCLKIESILLLQEENSLSEFAKNVTVSSSSGSQIRGLDLLGGWETLIAGLRNAFQSQNLQLHPLL